MKTKTILLPFLLLILLTQTSCLSMIEELFLKKDGSGKYSITMDMSGLFDDEKMAGMFESMFKDIEGGEKLIGEEGEGELQAEEEEGTSYEDRTPKMMDSTIVYNSPEAKEAFKEHPDMLDRIQGRIVANEEEKVFKYVFTLDFKNLKEIDFFNNNFDKLEPKEEDAEKDPMDDMFSGLATEVDELYTLNGTKFVRKDSPVDTEEQGEQLEFMKMIFGESTYSNIVHLPGKVKKASNSASKISTDGKTVTTEIPFVDFLEGKKNLGNKIKMK